MKESLKARVRRRANPRGTVVPSPAMAIVKVSPGVRTVGTTSRIPGGVGKAHDDEVRVGSLRTDGVRDLTVADDRRCMPEERDMRAVPVSVSPGQIDLSTDYMPAGVGYLHLPPCDPPDEFRRLHLCLMVGEDGEIVGSGYGSTWVKARTEACAFYRRSRIRCVSVSEVKYEREPDQMA